MTIKERLAALPEISPRTIKENFSFEDFKFEILEAMVNKTPDYTGVPTIFMEVDQELDDEPYNIFRERLTLKMFYLFTVYGIDFDILNAMLSVLPIAVLDKRMDSEIFGNDDMFAYVKDAFKEHKVNNGLTLSTVMKYMNTIDLQPLAKELEKSVGDLTKLANKK